MNNKDVETYGNRLEDKEEMTAAVLCWGFQAVLASFLCLSYPFKSVDFVASVDVWAFVLRKPLILNYNFFIFVVRALSLCVCKLSCTCHTAEKLLDVTPSFKETLCSSCSIEVFQAAELSCVSQPRCVFLKIN